MLITALQAHFDKCGLILRNTQSVHKEDKQSALVKQALLLVEALQKECRRIAIKQPEIHGLDFLKDPAVAAVVAKYETYTRDEYYNNFARIILAAVRNQSSRPFQHIYMQGDKKIAEALAQKNCAPMWNLMKPCIPFAERSPEKLSSNTRMEYSNRVITTLREFLQQSEDPQLQACARQLSIVPKAPIEYYHELLTFFLQQPVELPASLMESLLDFLAVQTPLLSTDLLSRVITFYNRKSGNSRLNLLMLVEIAALDSVGLFPDVNVLLEKISPYNNPQVIAQALFLLTVRKFPEHDIAQWLQKIDTHGKPDDARKGLEELLKVADNAFFTTHIDRVISNNSPSDMAKVLVTLRVDDAFFNKYFDLVIAHQHQLNMAHALVKLRAHDSLIEECIILCSQSLIPYSLASAFVELRQHGMLAKEEIDFLLRSSAPDKLAKFMTQLKEEGYWQEPYKSLLYLLPEFTHHSDSKVAVRSDRFFFILARLVPQKSYAVFEEVLRKFLQQFSQTKDNTLTECAEAVVFLLCAAEQSDAKYLDKVLTAVFAKMSDYHSAQYVLKVVQLLRYAYNNNPQKINFLSGFNFLLSRFCTFPASRAWELIKIDEVTICNLLQQKILSEDNFDCISNQSDANKPQALFLLKRFTTAGIDAPSSLINSLLTPNKYAELEAVTRLIYEGLLTRKNLTAVMSQSKAVNSIIAAKYKADRSVRTTPQQTEGVATNPYRLHAASGVEAATTRVERSLPKAFRF